MAPEQDGDAHESTPRTDVYAVGAIMSWLLTGRRPRPGRVELPDHVSDLRHVIWKATRERQSDRYFDLEDLKAAVLAARDPQHRALADLVAGHEYSQVGVFAVANPSAYGDLIEELPRFSKQDVVDWYARDPSSLTATVHAVLQELIDQGVGDLAFSNVDRFMSWALHTVEADLPRDRDRAEMLAVVLFKAIADIHQFAPAKDVLNWLDRCSISDQRVMEGALRMAGAWEFFSAQASGRFVTSRTSPLVRRLAGELAG
jgi:serine/threonine protein kinase